MPFFHTLGRASEWFVTQKTHFASDQSIAPQDVVGASEFLPDAAATFGAKCLENLGHTRGRHTKF